MLNIIYENLQKELLRFAAMALEYPLSGVLPNSHFYLSFKDEPAFENTQKSRELTTKYNEIFRFICGTQDIHKQLEAKIARSQKKIFIKMTRPNRFHEREASILYPSCFDANAGLFEQICGPEVDFNIPRA